MAAIELLQGEVGLESRYKQKKASRLTPVGGFGFCKSINPEPNLDILTLHFVPQGYGGGSVIICTMYGICLLVS